GRWRRCRRGSRSHLQRVAPGVRHGHTSGWRRRFSGIAMPVPADDRVHDAPVLQRNDIHRTAGVLAAVPEEEIGVFTRPAGRRGSAPQTVDLALAHAGSDRTRVIRYIRNVTVDYRAFRR